MFSGIIDTYEFSSLGGGERFWTHCEGGKFWTRCQRGGEQFWILNFLESLGKIKGHV